MKILNNDKKFIIKCECGCNFEYDLLDVQETGINSRRWGHGCVKCPVCQKEYCHQTEGKTQTTKKILFG